MILMCFKFLICNSFIITHKSNGHRYSKLMTNPGFKLYSLCVRYIQNFKDKKILSSMDNIMSLLFEYQGANLNVII